MLLPPTIRGEPIHWDAAQQACVARWTFKTALMLDRSSLASRVAPPHQFRFLFEHQSPPLSVTVYLARHFPSVGEEHVGVIGSSYRPSNVNTRLYPDPYQITFSIGQAVFQVFGHSGTARLEIRRVGQLNSGLIAPMSHLFEQLWPIRASTFAWPPAGGHLDTRSLQALARF
jgi:hypothetical protein